MATSAERVSQLQQYPSLKIYHKQDFTPGLIKRAVAQATQSPQLTIESFGPLKVWRDGKLIGHWEDQQIECLFKILLTRQVNGGQAVSARELISLLWEKPGLDDYSKLLPLVNDVRLALEPGIEPRATSFILRNSTGFSLDIGSNVDWDVLKFRELKNQGKYLIDTQQWDQALGVLTAAQQLYHDDYLANEDASWVTEVRRQLNKEYVGILTDLADAYAAHEKYLEAIQVCEETLVRDPLVESVYRRLMRFYYWLGRKEEAVKTYRMCVKLFEDLFGETPKPVTRQLYQDIIQDGEIVNILL
jgi:DNA-binding SARP family transcriptional activator